MAKKHDTLVIDDLSFETVQFKPMRAATLVAKLLKLLGGALIAITEAGPEADLASVASSIQGALSDLDPNIVAPLICEILSGTAVTYNDPDKGLQRKGLASSEVVDQVFDGRLRDLFKVVGFALQVNYADFSDGSASAPSALPTPAPSAS